MKLFISFILTMLTIQLSFGQAKKPKLMVIPSRQWCFDNNYYTEVDNFGVKEKMPDYQRAMDENHDLLLAIAKINTLFTDRGFSINDLSATLSSIKQGAAEDAAMNADRQSSGKGAIAENIYDRITNIAKADIIIELSWNIQSQGPQKELTFIMRGIDAYTNKQIAGANGISEPSMSASVPVLLQEAVLHNIDNFNAQLQTYFDDLFANGREIKIEFRRDATWTNDFETEYSGKELSAIIEDWMASNTVKGRFSSVDATENKLVFEQVRIPVYDANQRSIDARAYGKYIQKYFKEAPFQIPCKIVTKGLGYVQLIFGQK